MATNYVVACWSGLRRVNSPRYMEDRPVFLRRHIESLVKLKHKLDQVTFVFANNPNEPPDYRKFINDLPQHIKDTNVVVMERPNIGYSYAAYDDVFRRYGDRFDKYLLMEDDYVFLKDNFDTEMEGVLGADPQCGFVSFVLQKGTKGWMMGRAERETPGGKATADRVGEYCPDNFVFPHIAVGLTRAKVLKDICDKFGRLPYASGAEHTTCKFEGQFALSLAIQKVGWKISDMVPKYRVEAFGGRGEHLKYGPHDKELYLSAIQFLVE